MGQRSNGKGVKMDLVNKVLLGLFIFIIFGFFLIIYNGEKEKQENFKETGLKINNEELRCKTFCEPKKYLYDIKYVDGTTENIMGIGAFRIKLGVTNRDE